MSDEEPQVMRNPGGQVIAADAFFSLLGVTCRLETADIGSATDYAQGVAVDSDGKIIVCGSSRGKMYTARYTTAGLDQRHFAQHRLSVVSSSRPASRPRAFAYPSVRDDPASLFHPPASVCTDRTIQSFPC